MQEAMQNLELGGLLVFAFIEYVFYWKDVKC